MNAELWVTQIDTMTEQVITLFNSIDDNQLNKKVNDSWSIAQNIEHIIIINQSYFPIIDALLANNLKTTFLGRFNFITRFFGNFLHKSVLATNTKKVKTFTIWEPSIERIENNLNTFKLHQKKLKEYIIQTIPLHQEIIHSPANKHIVYSLAAAWQIIVSHEQRHINQCQKLIIDL